MTLKYWSDSMDAPTKLVSFKGGKDLKHPITGKQIPSTYYSRMNEAQRASDDVYDINVVKPELSYGQKYGNIIYDTETRSATYDVLEILPEVLTAKEDAKRIEWQDKIDVAAGTARKFFAPYELLDEEYSRTYRLTLDWTIDVIDNPSLIPPLVLSSWATASGMSVEDAAENILATGDSYNQFMDAVRALRLLGKTSVANAAGEDIETTGQAVVDSITALYAPPEEVVDE